MCEVEKSLHRGSQALTWLKGGVYDLEQAFQPVAHELAKGLQIQPFSKVVVPPKEIEGVNDYKLIEAFNLLLNGHQRGIQEQEKYRDNYLYVVAWKLSIPEILQMINITKGEIDGKKIVGLGCGYLIIPEKFTGENSWFPLEISVSNNQASDDEAAKERYIPVRRCWTILERDS